MKIRLKALAGLVAGVGQVGNKFPEDLIDYEIGFNLTNVFENICQSRVENEFYINQAGNHDVIC